MEAKKILDEAGKALDAIDEALGYVVPDRVIAKHHAAVEAVAGVGHYETVATYPNGGKDQEWVWDVLPVAAREAWDEYEDVLRYVPYTLVQLAERARPTPEQRLAAIEGVIDRLRDAMTGNALLKALVDSIWPEGGREN